MYDYNYIVFPEVNFHNLIGSHRTERPIARCLTLRGIATDGLFGDESISGPAFPGPSF